MTLHNSYSPARSPQYYYQIGDHHQRKTHQRRKSWWRLDHTQRRAQVPVPVNCFETSVGCSDLGKCGLGFGGRLFRTYWGKVNDDFSSGINDSHSVFNPLFPVLAKVGCMLGMVDSLKVPHYMCICPSK